MAYRWFLLSSLLWTLLACSPANERQLDNYQSRLERVAGIQPGQVTPAAVDPLPSARSLLHPLPDLRLDLLDAWASRQCGLDALIAERNSSLGRVQSHSLRLNYELRLLQQLEQCQQNSSLAPALQQQLADIQSSKQDTIELSFFNMLHADQTLRQQWHGQRQLLPLQGQQALLETQHALQQLNALRTAIDQQDWQQAAAIDIEAALGVLHRYQTLASLQYSQRYLVGWLDALNSSLLPIPADSFCPNQRPSDTLSILSTVFLKFFAEELQPYFNQHQRHMQALWPELVQLYAESPLLPLLEQRYQDTANTLQQQILAHVGWWQQLNAECPAGLTSRH
ncbi:DUF3080 family protein [Alkalimonas delamerensis]|uniref:DUF3080 family protein n=1 Tax=Alkalimonas delamerensis TaxID=265981 RepID=A0ABT9GNI5_9GAMM|nr:DUF3080 family protein [Alkalimonas delamerensis]MDP4528530.1 DUF3080 family protein [Alkalimonas delamerensis]